MTTVCHIKVAAAIIENNDKEILCALRSPSMSLANHWEFPGGKLETDESVKEAIEREILEELDCKIEFMEVFNENTYEYDSFVVELISTKCKLISGTPTASEHSKLIWLKRENLKSLVWAPADIAAVEALMSEKV